MSRRGENIYKRRDGRWEGRILIDSRYHAVYAHSYSEVKQKLRNYSDTTKSTAKANRQTVAEYAIQWLATVKLKCKASTHNKYSNTCRITLSLFWEDTAFPSLPPRILSICLNSGNHSHKKQGVISFALSK